MDAERGRDESAEESGSLLSSLDLTGAFQLKARPSSPSGPEISASFAVCRRQQICRSNIDPFSSSARLKASLHSSLAPSLPAFRCRGLVCLPGRVCRGGLLADAETGRCQMTDASGGASGRSIGAKFAKRRELEPRLPPFFCANVSASVLGEVKT